MRVVLFDGQDRPEVGEVFVVKNVYPFSDGCYGPRVAVVLEKIQFSARVEFDQKLFEETYDVRK